MKEVIRGVVARSDLDQLDHLSMYEILRFYNDGVQQLSQSVYGRGGREEEGRKRFVAARAELQFKKEMAEGDQWRLELGLREIKAQFITLHGRILVGSSTVNRCSLVLVGLDLATRRSEALSLEEEQCLRDALEFGI